MFQSELAELTLLVAIKKSLDFYLCSDRLGFLITRSTSLETKVRIHVLTHMGTESTESRRGWRLEDFEDREGGEQRKANTEIVWRDYALFAAAREVKGWAGSLYCGGSFRPCI